MQNPTAPSPLNQMPPNDGIPGGPMPPSSFFAVSAFFFGLGFLLLAYMVLVGPNTPPFV